MARYLQLVNHGIEAGYMGDYASAKDYHILKSNLARDTTVNGYVVQLVQKTTRATHEASGKVLNTSDAIAAFTSRKIKFMCDSYIELFPIVNGEIGDNSVDEFASGPIALVEKGQSIVITPAYSKDDAPYRTSGTIEHIGTSYLFTNAHKIARLNSAEFPWTKLAVAGGLSTLDTSYWDLIVAMGSDAANIPVHSVHAEWAYKPSKTILSCQYIGNKVASEAPVEPETPERAAFCSRWAASVLAVAQAGRAAAGAENARAARAAARDLASRAAAPVNANNAPSARALRLARRAKKGGRRLSKKNKRTRKYTRKNL